VTQTTVDVGPIRAYPYPDADRPLMSHDEPREARLRAEFADQYPGIPAGVWLPAGELTARWLTAMGRNRSKGRRLPIEHFELRGGRAEAPARGRARTRGSDQPVPIDEGGAPPKRRPS